jgi:hypothetical protein
MTSNDDPRIAALERELRSLRVLLTSPQPKPQPNAVEDGVRVHKTSTVHPGFVIPSADEIDQLIAIVCRRFPVLRSGISAGRFAAQDEADFRREFEAAFRALGSVNRMADGVDEKHGPDRWIRVVQSRLQGGSQVIHLLPFAAACIAHGDIPFTLANNMMGSSFGLRDDGAGTAATDAWRRVISSNTTLNSLPLPGYRAWSMGMRAGGAR